MFSLFVYKGSTQQTRKLSLSTDFAARRSLLIADGEISGKQLNYTAKRIVFSQLVSHCLKVRR